MQGLAYAMGYDQVAGFETAQEEASAAMSTSSIGSKRHVPSAAMDDDSGIVL